MIKQFNLFILCYITNFLFSMQELSKFQTKIVTSIEDDLEGFYIDNKNTESQCNKWHLSIFLPI